MSDPTDLIREADAALAREAANEGGPIVDDPADLVRRLRDALEASEQERERFENARAFAVVKAADLTSERDEARAALAEANATIAALREREETAGHIADVETFKAVEANAELVKAQATIERVRALADEWEAGIGGTVATLALRRAIEGPQS